MIKKSFSNFTFRHWGASHPARLNLNVENNLCSMQFSKMSLHILSYIKNCLGFIVVFFARVQTSETGPTHLFSLGQAFHCNTIFPNLLNFKLVKMYNLLHMILLEYIRYWFVCVTLVLPFYVWTFLLKKVE